LGLAIQYDEKLQKQIRDNVNNSNCDLNKKYSILSKAESGNFGYIKNAFNIKFDIFKLYKDFIANIEKYSTYENIDILKKQTLINLKSKKLAYDDLASIIYLYGRIFEFPYYSKLKCIFIDEAQDISALMFLGLRKIFKNASFSIFGDIAQGIYSYQAIDDWQDVTDIIGDCELLYLKRSYRTSIEIMAEANKVLLGLGYKLAENVIRHGEGVEYINKSSKEVLSDQLKKLNGDYLHTAIICKNDEELELAQKELENLNIMVIDESNLNYDNLQNTMLTVQTAKGLEFDSVIIYNFDSYNKDNANDQKLLYVAETRALHKLIINGCV
jgi:DNA helicase-2/ATP-dependent DNA helicase PcrA